MDPNSFCLFIPPLTAPCLWILPKFCLLYPQTISGFFSVSDLPRTIRLLVLPCPQASLAVGWVFHLWPLPCSHMQTLPTLTLAVAVVRKLLNQEAATTASGSSFTLAWRGSWAELGKYYHRDSLGRRRLTQSVGILFLKDRMLERNYPKKNGRIRFFGMEEPNEWNQGEVTMWCL